MPEHIATPLVFKAVVVVTLAFSIPDVIGNISPSEGLNNFTTYMPLAKHSLGWVLPALVAFVISSYVQLKIAKG